MGLVAWGGEVFPQPPLCLELYHIFVMDAHYGCVLALSSIGGLRLCFCGDVV